MFVYIIMSLKALKSKDTNHIFGTAYIYKTEKGDWVKITSPEIGDIKFSIRSDNHYGWLKCDGTAISRTDYANLYSVIGTSFGSGDGTTFNLPDCRGRVLGAIGQGNLLTNRVLGANVGAETHTLITAEIPSHNHGITDPGHTHSYVNNTNDQGVNTLTTQDSAADDADLSATTGSSTTGITINNTGGGGAHNNMQPTSFIGNVFIFADHQINL